MSLVDDLEENVITLIVLAVVAVLAFDWIKKQLTSTTPDDTVSNLSLSDAAAGATTPGGPGQSVQSIPEGGWVGRYSPTGIVPDPTGVVS